MAIADLDLDAAILTAGEESYHVGSPHLGPSKISTYLKCPRQYEMTYVLKLPAPKSPHAAVGTIIHKLIHHAHVARWTPDDAPRAAEAVLAMWEQVRETTSDPGNPEVAKRMQLAATEWLPWYLHWMQGQTTIATEEHWVLDYQGVTLEGTIDRIYRQHGKIIISDVKSGARKPTPTDLRNDLQLTMYPWAGREMGVREDAAELVWLWTQEQLQTRRTDDYIEAVLQDTVLPVARAIQAGIFPANPSSKYGCDYCAYKMQCAVGRGCEEERPC